MKKKVSIKGDTFQLTKYRKGVIVKKVLGDKEISEGINGLMQRLNMLCLMLDDCRTLIHQRKDKSVELVKCKINEANSNAILLVIIVCIVSTGLCLALLFIFIHWTYN